MCATKRRLHRICFTLKWLALFVNRMAERLRVQRERGGCSDQLWVFFVSEARRIAIPHQNKYNDSVIK